MRTLKWLSGLLMGVSILLSHVLYAGKPLWTVVPLTAVNYIVTPQTAPITIQYTVTNNLKSSVTLQLKGVPGITQSSQQIGQCNTPSFTLGALKSCTLYLTVNPGQLAGSVDGGPTVCRSNSTLQCYQPAAGQVLDIKLLTPDNGILYAVTSSAGANGSVTPNGQTVVKAGANLTLTATPINEAYQVDEWTASSGKKTIHQTGGTTFILPNIQTNYIVNVSFQELVGTIFAGTQAVNYGPGGQVFYSIADSGFWTAFNYNPSPSSASVLSVVASATVPGPLVFAATEDNNVYYSSNHGATPWTTLSPYNGVSNIHPTLGLTLTTSNPPILYAATANSAGHGIIYYGSTGSLPNPTWNSLTEVDFCLGDNFFSATSIAVDSYGNHFAGCSNGHVYSLAAGRTAWTDLGAMPDGSPNIQSVYLAYNGGTTFFFVNTGYGNTYFTVSLVNPILWRLYAQSVFSLYVSADRSTIDAGMQMGYVYSLLTGNNLGTVTTVPTQVNTLFLLYG